MDEIIRRLIRKHKTTCPFTIAKNIKIDIRFDDLGQATRGMYYRKLRRRFIAINNRLPEEWRRFICAHELGHDQLHPGVSRFFLDEQSFFNPGKYERQANRFAFKLLTNESELQSGESIIDFCRNNDIPIELHHLFY